MTSFVDIPTGKTPAAAVDIQQIIDALKGTSGKGVAIALTAVNDAIAYALSVKNLDATNSRAVALYGADGNPLLTIDKNGVQASPYGTNSLAPVVTTSATQTLSNKTLGAGNTVQTTALAANAATYDASAVGSTSGPTTVSGAYVDLPDMVVNPTTVGGDVLVWLNGIFTATLGAVNIALSLDGGAEVAPASQTVVSNGAAMTVTTVWLFSGVAAGAHTIKGRWLQTGGGTITAVGTTRRLVMLELRR